MVDNASFLYEIRISSGLESGDKILGHWNNNSSVLFPAPGYLSAIIKRKEVEDYVNFRSSYRTFRFLDHWIHLVGDSGLVYSENCTGRAGKQFRN